VLKELLESGGREILDKYNWSSPLLLSAAYPELEWLPWKFASCPQNYWDDVQNQRTFMDWATKKLNIKDMSDWYKVSVKVNMK
jgi:hypothetical protein